jgi:hypothetical protein
LLGERGLPRPLGRRRRAEVPTSEPLNPGLAQRLRDTLAGAVELEETFDAQHPTTVGVADDTRRHLRNSVTGIVTAPRADLGRGQ